MPTSPPTNFGVRKPTKKKGIDNPKETKRVSQRKLKVTHLPIVYLIDGDSVFPFVSTVDPRMCGSAAAVSDDPPMKIHRKEESDE